MSQKSTHLKICIFVMYIWNKNKIVLKKNPFLSQVTFDKFWCWTRVVNPWKSIENNLAEEGLLFDTLLFKHQIFITNMHIFGGKIVEK